MDLLGLWFSGLIVGLALACLLGSWGHKYCVEKATHDCLYKQFETALNLLRTVQGNARIKTFLKEYENGPCGDRVPE